MCFDKISGYVKIFTRLRENFNKITIKMNPKYKKIIIILASALLIGLLLFVFFFSKRDKIKLGWDSDIYTGFLLPEKGAWSELIVYDEEGNESLQRSIYLGESSLEGVRIYGVETDPNVYNSSGSVLQVWYDYTNDEIVKMASKEKQGQDIICVNVPLMETLFPTLTAYLPTVVTPDKYSSINRYTYDTYTTETGKTIQTAKFVDDYETEIWLSTEIPFGIVKGVYLPNNLIVAYLRDFGLFGATPLISETQAINCQPIKLLSELSE